MTKPVAAAPRTVVCQEQRDRVASDLLGWYRLHKRDLPWRGASPYAVWISEIMLQQTQVATVVPFFLRFVERFPTVDALAAAPLDDVLQCWAGMGYYARARNLHRAAQRMAAEFGGAVPDTSEAIRTLPGIGPYTAGAILSIAYDLPMPIVDGNVVRVLCRLFGLRGDPKAAKNLQNIWSTAEQLVPAKHPGDFNQGLMELGALICRPEDPLCERCPLLRDCVAGNSVDPTALPEIPAGRATVTVTHCSGVASRYVIGTNNLEFLIVRRPMHGLWGGLWEFPRVVCEKGEAPQTAGARALLEVAGIGGFAAGQIALIKHSVTHHRINLHGVAVRPDPPIQEGTAITCAEVRWVELGKLGSYAFAAPQALLRDAVRARVTAVSEGCQGELDLWGD